MRQLSSEITPEIVKPLSSALMIAGLTVFITWAALKEKRPTGWGLAAASLGAFLAYRQYNRGT